MENINLNKLNLVKNINYKKNNHCSIYI